MPDSSLVPTTETVEPEGSLLQPEATEASRMTMAERRRPVPLLSWSAPSRIPQARTGRWFLGLFTVGLLLVLALAVLQEVMLILVVVAAIFVYYALARVEPVEVEHTIFTTGINSGGRMYLWKELRSFWVYEQDGVEMLRVDTTLHFPHALELLLTDVEAEDVHDVLINYLPALEKAPSEAGQMADNALLSLADKVPYRDTLLRWVEDKTGTKLHAEVPPPASEDSH